MNVGFGYSAGAYGGTDETQAAIQLVGRAQALRSVSRTTRRCERSRANAMAASISARPAPLPRNAGSTYSRLISSVDASNSLATTHPAALPATRARKIPDAGST